MRRLFWVGVGAAAAVATLRKAREVTDKHVPAGARSALGAAAGLAGALQRAQTEFRTATAQREAQLRADLLAGADLTRSRAAVDAWRADRSARRASSGQDEPASAAPDRAGDPGTADATGTTRRGRPGSARGAADRTTPLRPAGGSHRAEPLRPAGGTRRAEDPEDGPEGYSFY